MFEQAFLLFDMRGMTLLADREYVGRNWFKFLKDNKIDFVIRLRVTDYQQDVNLAKGGTYEQLLSKCAAQNRLVKKQIRLNGQAYTFVMMPNPKNEAEEVVMIFLTTLQNAAKAAKLYAKRWKIECLFKYLKTNGFNLEDMNLKDPGKNLLMMAVAAMAYVLAIREGLKRKSKIKMQQYRNGSATLEVSLFREGLAALTAKCFRIIDFLKYVFRCLNPSNRLICKNVQ